MNTTTTLLPEQFDPFHPPAATPISAVHARDRVAVTGTVTELRPRALVGGPALEAVVTDATDSVTILLFGRTKVAGIECGRRLTVGGTVGQRYGDLVFLNPYLWLTAEVTAPKAAPVAPRVHAHPRVRRPRRLPVPAPA